MINFFGQKLAEPGPVVNVRHFHVNTTTKRLVCKFNVLSVEIKLYLDK